MATATTNPLAPNVPQRSEDDILAMSPLRVRLGSDTYDVKLLAVIPQRRWRESLVAEVKAITAAISPEASSTPAFLEGLGFLFLQFPEKIADLVFSYAKDLPRDKIEGEATEEQLARAFGMIMQIAFPFVGELRALTQTVGLAASFPQLVNSTK